ncbi:MAG: alpha/beta hydrolase, partial [Acidimicrobiia bacterium]|nr:alpha/beta hydrolase [Acidimicrobiia bacterium]
MLEWGHELERAERRPGLVIIATEDAFTGGETLSRRSAQRFGAQIGVIEGAGHWWMLQDPAAGAILLRDFFAGLD